jgi:peroxiredoxin
LRRWEELRPQLDARGVQIVTLCTDTPEKIAAQRAKHGLQAVMLADPDGSVTKQLGIQNRAVNTGPPGGPRLPIPTTVLASADGRVVWIDQSKDYQRRSDPVRVRRALEEHVDASA